MIDFLDVLNFDLQLKTKFCCYGHTEHDDLYIMFDECVSDEQIFELANYLKNHLGNFGRFHKSVRSPGQGDLLINWMYYLGARFSKENEKIKQDTVDYIVKKIKSFKYQ